METTLREQLARRTREGELWRATDGNRLLCYACGHRCRIAPGREGICRVRFNRDGVLQVPYGYVAGVAVDPIEKKPFYHVLPGSAALSFGMLGCDYHCAYCQNWITSQALRDPAAGAPVQKISPEELVGLALQHRAPVITSTYNEPLITSEWAVDIFRRAVARGVRCAYVSNGNATPEVLEYLRPYVRFFKVDLKSYRARTYQQLGGRLETVLRTIRSLVAMGVWVEVVTLTVPGFNDSDDELRAIAGFLASVSPDIPWHVTAFHQDYRMADPAPTSARTLLRAAEIGTAEGLRFVYTGNLPGMTGRHEHTYCPSCGELLVERFGFRVTQNRISGGGCPRCSAAIPGVWN